MNNVIDEVKYQFNKLKAIVNRNYLFLFLTLQKFNKTLSILYIKAFHFKV